MTKLDSRARKSVPHTWRRLVSFPHVQKCSGTFRNLRMLRLWKTNPTSERGSVDDGLQWLTAVDEGLPNSQKCRTNPAGASQSVDRSLPKLTRVDARLPGTQLCKSNPPRSIPSMHPGCSSSRKRGWEAREIDPARAALTKSVGQTKPPRGSCAGQETGVTLR